MTLFVSVVVSEKTDAQNPTGTAVVVMHGAVTPRRKEIQTASENRRQRANFSRSESASVEGA